MTCLSNADADCIQYFTHNAWYVWRYGAGVSWMNHQELLSRSGTGVGMSGGDQASNLTVHIAIIWSAVAACVEWSGHCDWHILSPSYPTHRAGRRETREDQHSVSCSVVSAVTSCGKVTISLYLCFKWLTGISTEFDDFLTYNNSFLSIFWREDNIFWCEFMVC